MYKILKRLLILISFIFVTFFAFWTVNDGSRALPGGKVESVHVLKATLSLSNDLEKIAAKYRILLAQQIIVSTDSGTGQLDYKFAKIGKGALPKIYPLETNSALIKNSNQATNYVIIGKTISAKELSNQLNASGNVTFPLNTDTRFDALLSLYWNFKFPILLILSTFLTLILAEQIGRLKSDGVLRLAGISRFRLSFSYILSDGIYILGLVAASIIVAIVYFLLTSRLIVAYVEEIGLTVATLAAILFLLNFLFSLLIFFLLQLQPVHLSVKGKSPLAILSPLIIIFQVFSILVSMSSISTLNSTNRQLATLEAGKATWKSNQQYFASSMIGLPNSIDPEALKSFAIELLNNPQNLLAVSPFNQAAQVKEAVGSVKYVYTLGNNPDEIWNVMIVNPTVLQKEKIKLPSNVTDQINSLSAGGYAILLPDNQAENKDKLFNDVENSQGQYKLAQTPVKAVYHPEKEMFGYSVLSQSQTNTQYSAKAPILIVYGSKTFINSDAKMIFHLLQSYFSNGSVLVTNVSQAKTLIQKYQLENNFGSFLNGYYAINERITEKSNQRNSLVIVNALSLLGSLLLISLLNTIYFYQFRRNTLIYRLSGKSSLSIHTTYISLVVLGVIMTGSIAISGLHMMLEALIILPIYIILLFLIFAMQLRHEKKLNILYLKGL